MAFDGDIGDIALPWGELDNSMPCAAKGGTAGDSVLASFFFSEELRKKLKALSIEFNSHTKPTTSVQTKALDYKGLFGRIRVSGRERME